jgi:hypothetical protein
MRENPVSDLRYHDGSMHARDTTPEAAAIQHEAYRRIGSAGRFNIAAELTNIIRDMALAGIRRRHPEFTPEQVSAQLVWYIYRQNAEDRED